MVKVTERIGSQEFRNRRSVFEKNGGEVPATQVRDEDLLARKIANQKLERERVEETQSKLKDIYKSAADLAAQKEQERIEQEKKLAEAAAKISQVLESAQSRKRKLEEKDSQEVKVPKLDFSSLATQKKEEVARPSSAPARIADVESEKSLAHVKYEVENIERPKSARDFSKTPPVSTASPKATNVLGARFRDSLTEYLRESSGSRDVNCVVRGETREGNKTFGIYLPEGRFGGKALKALEELCKDSKSGLKFNQVSSRGGGMSEIRLEVRGGFGAKALDNLLEKIAGKSQGEGR